MQPRTTDLVHPAASQFWAATLRPDDRILIIGASGWFGRTAFALNIGLDHPRLLVSSRARSVETPFGVLSCVAWDLEVIRRFSPTIVVDCAFLTRDLVATMSLDEYVDANRSLTSRLVLVSRLRSVRQIITVSSGAAVYPADALTQPIQANPYGWLKREAEELLSTLAEETGIAVSIARAWSVSGSLVQKPRNYALSDFILQAADGAVSITAREKVYRRYVSVEDLLAVSLACGETGRSNVIDSGGELIEMGELAERVVAVVNPAATVSRPQASDASANRYYSDNLGWLAAIGSLDFPAAALDAQIHAASVGLLKGEREGDN